MKVEFWNKYAPFYNLFMKKDEKMYREMFSLIRRQVMGKTVLEVATGTGLIAKNIADCTKRTDATDYSEKMIQQAKKNCSSKNLTFSVQNAYHLTFADDSYDVVIISNALHIMTDPEKALQEIGRVLKKDGLLIAPTFVQGNINVFQSLLLNLMHIIGFTPNKWTAKEYLDFLQRNGWRIKKYKKTGGWFPLAYVECIYNKGE